MKRVLFPLDEQSMSAHRPLAISAKHQTDNFYLRSWQYIVCFLALLVSLTFTSVESSLNSVYAASVVSMKQATFTVDNVSIHLQSNVLPNTHFQSTKPGDFIQRALVIRDTPYTSVSVTAVPYGTRGDDHLPTAQAGIAAIYRSQLRTDWQNQTQAAQNAPAINLFGTKISGTLYHVQMPLDSLISKPALITEWIGEAGLRVWIVRVIQEGTSPNELLQQLQGTTLTSTTLSNGTTLQTHLHVPTKANAHFAAVGNLPYPSVWNGTLCDTYNHPTAYQLGTASYRGVPACGPRPAYDTDNYADLPVQYFSGAWGELEFECVELVMRYMYLGYNISPYGANGNQVVSAYSGSTLQKESSNNNTINSNLSAGDILSWNNGSSAGHTSLVSSVSLDSNGNGTITTIEQNASANGTFTYPVSNWVLNTEGYGSLLGWLHVPGGTTSNPDNDASSKYVGQNQDGTLEVFALGSNGNIWHNYQTSAGAGWVGWGELQSGQQFQGNPVVAKNQNGALEVFALGSNGNIWHNYQTSAGAGWVGWGELQSGRQFQGDPDVVLNADGRLEVFARGSDNNIWHDYQTSAGAGWVGWGVIQSNEQFQGHPTVGINTDGRLEVFARGSDNNIWHNYQTSAGAGWVGWGVIQSNEQFQDSPIAGKNADGRLEVFARGTDNNIWHNYQSNGAWSSWSAVVPGYQFNSNVAVGYNADGRMEIFARSTDNTVWHTYQVTASGGYSTTWQQLQTNQFYGTPAVATNSNGKLETFAFGTDNNIWHNYQLTAGTGNWNGWGVLQTGVTFQQ